ncbi:FAD-binding protein [Eggerthellaceae bacterium 24-137]
MQSNVSRRSFFKGAGLAALGGLSAAALSGCGHGYAAETPANPSAGDFGGPSWLGAPPVVEESDIAETIDTEVLVVGIGTGGIPAMISAAENGAKVLGIDRQGTPKNVREDIGAIDSRLQQASFDEFPEFRIEKKEAVEDIVRYANGFVNYDLVKLWADESGAMVDWLTDIVQRDGKMVMEFEGGVGDTTDPGRDKAFATGHSPQLTDAVGEDEEWGFAESILAYAAEQGAEVRWFTEFIKCETDEAGRVTGVIARDVQDDRRYLRINASKGVILSTGGYGNNLEMMEDRQAWNQKIRIAAPGSGGNPTGSGIKAALWLGATMDPLGAACTFNRACVKPDQTAGDGVLGRWFWFGEQPFLKLNLKGQRFCNESGPYDYMLHSTIMQPHQTYVDIWDANHAAQAEAMDEVGCCRLFLFPNGAKNNIPMQVVDGMIEKLIEDGYVQKADTMEELAEKLNLPVEATVASWKRYNEMAAAGEDTDYYKEKHRLMAIDTPPFYGVRTGAWFLATLDGVTIDTNMHPCDENGDAIEGLYLTGNDSGGFFSVSYPNLLTGLACGRTMTFGRRAGMLAATGQA